MTKCLNPNNPKDQFLYCPSLGAAILFSILFALTTTAHVVQAIMYRKTFCWVIIMAGLWETGGLIVRALSVENPTSGGLSETSQLLILLAPLWVNAFDYMILGRMVYYFLPDQKIMGFNARKLALCFVLLDISAFLVQGTGGLMTNSTDPSTVMRGTHIYMGGIGLQESFILLFIYLATAFQRRAAQLGYATRPTDWRRMLYALYGSLTLITIRIIFRLVEFSRGFRSTLTTHEAFYYCLDALPMFSALVLFNIWHPGTVLLGQESEFSKKPKNEKTKDKDNWNALGSESSLNIVHQEPGFEQV